MRDHSRHLSALRLLLDRLAPGGDPGLITLDDWLEYLPPRPHTPLDRYFRCALTFEWPDASPPTSLCADVADHVRDYLQSRRGTWVSLYSHLLRVTGYTLTIAEARGIDTEMVFLAGILHDVRKFDQRIDGGSHEELGAEYAAHLLRGEVPDEQQQAIVRAIGVHPERPPLSWPVACALYDADKLDKVGASGLLRRVSICEDLDEACDAAYRTIDDADMLPALCFTVSQELLNPKLAFTRTITPLLDDLCP